MVTQHVTRALLIGAVLGSAAVLAQPGSGGAELSAVLECAAIEREILRLECYDEAVAALRARQAESASARSAAAARVDTETGASAARREADAPARENAAAPPVVAERNLQGGAAVRAERSDAPDAGRDEGERQVTVVEVRTTVPGRAVFVTSDGEEFVQTSGRLNLYLPDVPFQANLRAGAVGGRFLTPEGTRRSIRIAQRN